MRLIDGDKLLAELNREKEFNRKQENIRREWDLIAYISQIESGRFDIPSNQGEARQREAIKEAMQKEWELAGEPTPVYTILHQALSSHTEGGHSDE